MSYITFAATQNIYGAGASPWRQLTARLEMPIRDQSIALYKYDRTTSRSLLSHFFLLSLIDRVNAYSAISGIFTISLRTGVITSSVSSKTD